MNSHRGRRTIPALRSRRRLRPAAEPLESRRLLSGLQLSQIFPLNSNFNEDQLDTSDAGPKMITAGSDGNLWFTESLASQIGMTDAAGNVSEFATPTLGSLPYGIAAGPDGNLWFTEAGASQIGVINPATDKILEFPTTTPNSAPHGIVAGPDGNLWFTEFAANRIGEINPTTHVIKEFPTSTAISGPEDITAGRDGNLWFTESKNNAIGMISPINGTGSEFPIPTANSGVEDITTGPDHNLWFTESNDTAGGTGIGRIIPGTGVITEFSVPTAGSQPTGITSGPDGNLWFTERQGNNIGSIDPATGHVTEAAIPTPGSFPWGITSGPDGSLWFAEVAGNNVVQHSPDNLVFTVEPPALLAPGAPFEITLTAFDQSGRVDTGFKSGIFLAAVAFQNGPAITALSFATSSNGVVTFSGLEINQPVDPSGMKINQAETVTLVAVALDPPNRILSTTVTVVAPTTIVAEKPIFAGRGKHQRLVGYELDFSGPLDPTRADVLANYAITQTLTHGRKLVTQPVTVQVAYDATARSVRLTLAGKPKFTRGGRLVVVARPPGGLADATDVPLDGGSQGTFGDDGTFIIAPRGGAISR